MRNSTFSQLTTNQPTNQHPRGRAWIPLLSLALLHAASACAPAGDTGDPGLELGSYDDGGVLDDKALPSASYQAESRTAQSGCAEATNYAGYTGASFMDFGGNGTCIEWNNISAPGAGRYALRMRYANGAAANRAAAILVNGQSIGSIPFAVTGGWDKWGTGSIDVSLGRGNNTIRVLANTSTGGPNVDRMDVVATDLCPSDSSKVEPGECGCGVPEGSCGPAVVGLLDRPSGTKLRLASWNVFRGSVFPNTDAIWQVINSSIRGKAARREGGARIFQTVKADIWNLQETVYNATGLPSGITLADINTRLAQYMQSVTGDTWSVRCNGSGLCTMIRGSLRFAESWNPHVRVAGNRVILADGSKVLIVNVHYMTEDQAKQTAALIQSAGTGDAAVFVGGDFNDTVNGARYNAVAAVPGIKPLSMFHLRDPAASHLADAVKNAPPFRNTKGYVTFDSGPAGRDVVTAVGGGYIDHFFLRSAWGSEHRFVLNTFLLSRATLGAQRLNALDVALEAEAYLPYFRDFATQGIVYELPADIHAIDHDHLPMIVDFTSP